MENSSCISKSNIYKIIYDIRKTVIFGYEGGTFANKDVQKAREFNQPLTLDCAIPGTCLNHCTYCGFLNVNKSDKLSLKELLDVIKEFSAIGGKSIKILGEGEPLLRKDILYILEYINSLGMTPVLFTCGDVIGSNELCCRVHGIQIDDLLNRLSECHTTVMLKFDGTEQDNIVQRQGYSKLRNRALIRLLRKGFNNNDPTHLGFATVLLNDNYEEIEEIYDFALCHNIYPLICPLMPIGKMSDPNCRRLISPTPKDINSLKSSLNHISNSYGIENGEESDFPGGRPCDMARSGMYLDDVGNINICESDISAGNIRNDSLKNIWQKCSDIKNARYGNMRWLGLCFPKRRSGIIRHV